MSFIEILPLGDANRTLVEGLITPLRIAFGVAVTVREVKIPLESFYDQERLQYNSTAILQCLHRHEGDKPTPTNPRFTASKTLAVFGHDLFIPILTYVFGEAELGGNAAVVSYNRLQNERYGLAPDKQLLAERLRKEAVHELGHAYGLIHCQSRDCVMHTSTYVEDIDLKGDHFCPECAEFLRIRRSAP